MSTTTAFYAFIKPTVAGDSGLWGGFWNTNADQLDTYISKPRIPFNSPTVGATTTCDLSVAVAFAFTVSQATTLAFTNTPGGASCGVVLYITNGSAFALTFPASVQWPAGVAPTFKVSGTDVVDLLTKDGGTTWFASLRRPTSGVLHTKTGLSTASTTEVSLDAFTVPAGTLGSNGQALRLSLNGLSATQNGHVRVKFGSTYWLNTGDTANASNGLNFFAQGLLMRSGASAATPSFVFHGNVSGAPLLDRPGMGEVFANALVVDVRGYVVSGGTLNVDQVLLELLGPG